MSVTSEQGIESVVIFFEDCSVFLLRKFGKTGHSSVVRDKGIRDKNIRSKHRKRVPTSVFSPSRAAARRLIARRVNATGNAYQEDIEEIKGVLAEIWRLQRLSLLKAP